MGMRCRVDTATPIPYSSRMADTNGTVGARIRRLRESVGLSTRELAIKIGCDHSKVVRMETGKQRVTVTQLLAIAEALEVRAARLLP